MVYSYVTHSKQDKYYIITFENDMENGELLVIKFLPKTPMVFSKENIDLSMMKMRDPEVILGLLEEHGITLILQGLQ